MKELLAGFAALALIGCADSGQGGPAPTESGSNGPALIPLIAAGDPTEPGVAPEPGTRPSQERDTTKSAVASEPVAKSEAEQSSTVASSTETARTDQTPSAEQGSQISPEPRTGDDANPDSVNPRR